MKKLFLAAVLALSVFSVQAEEKHFCESVGELATVVMQKRQEGIDLSKMLALAKDNSGVKAIVLDAYNSPRYSTDKYIADAISDFSNKWVLACHTE